ncbi:MAG: phosphatidate cytidylyltransferase [Alphaproteobacteria bacterium]|nr:MAG: hypothetical protein B6I23_01080 [Rickettsiaceae bacterium 4572_127]
MKLLKNLSNLQKRIIGAGMLLVFGIVFFVDLFLGGDNYLATGVYYIFSAGIIWEFFNLIEDKKAKLLSRYFALLLVFSVLIYINQNGFNWYDFIFPLFCGISSILIYGKKTERKKDFFCLLSLIIYLSALIFINKAMNLLLPKTPDPLGAILLLVIFFITITTDIGAYFVGKKFGKKKLAPKISPNKTWAGFLGGILFPTTIVIIYLLKTVPIRVFANNFYVAVKVISFYILTTIILSIIAQLGDLFESYLKRLNGAKDSGKIIIGHGGLLDRFDSFLFLIFWIGIVIYIFGVN